MINLVFILLCGVIKDDFLVNTDTQGRCRHLGPAIAANSSGEFVVVWQDLRDGNPEWDIYGQRFTPSGEPAGVNFRVNDDPYPTNHVYPAVAIADDGSFFAIWFDGRDRSMYEGWSIWGQLYDASGNPVGGNFEVEDNDHGHKAPSIATNGFSLYIAVWEAWEERDDIYGRMFDISGEPLGPEFEIHSEAGYQQLPSVAMSSSGDFVVAWTSSLDYSGTRDIYASRFDSAGNSQGQVFLVNDDTTGNQIHPSVGMDNLKNFWVVWQDNRNGDYDIYCQRYQSNGDPIGSSFKVTDDATGADQTVPRVAVAPSGEAYVVWVDDRDGDESIYCQHFGSAGNAIGSNTLISQGVHRSRQFSPEIAISASADPVVVWEEGYSRNPDCDIYAQMIGESSENFRVSDDVGSSHQGGECSVFSPLDACVAMNTSGRFVVAWKDSRDGTYKPYAKVYDENGNSITEDILTNTDGDTLATSMLDVDIDEYGDFVIVWSEGGDKDLIYAQPYSASGDPKGSRLLVNNDTTAHNSAPAVAVYKDGDFIIVWCKDHGIDGDMGEIYAQLYDKNSNPIGTNFRVNDDTLGPDQDFPDIAYDDEGNFVIVWWDDRNDPGSSKGDIYARLYDKNGNPLGSDFPIAPGLEGYKRFPAVAVDATGNFTVVWIDTNDPEGARVARYDSDGNPVGDPFLIGGKYLIHGMGIMPASIAMHPSGKFVVLFADNGGRPQIKGRVYDPEGNLLRHSSINEPRLFIYSWFCPAARGVAASSDRIAFIWADNRRHKGWDIYAEVTDWDIGIGVEESPVFTQSPIRLSASLNRLSYNVPGEASLTLYSADGRKVLEKIIQGKGIWAPSSHLPSGVYFARVEGEASSTTQKVVLIR